MKERLDRFVLVNLLLKEAQKTKELKSIWSAPQDHFAQRFSKLPTSWWLLIRKEPDTIQRDLSLLNEIIRYVISMHKAHIKWRDTYPAVVINPSYGIEPYVASVLLADKAAHHIARYGGADWEDHIETRYRVEHVPENWLSSLTPPDGRGISSALDTISWFLA